MEHTIIVATAGQGMLRSNNNGQSWHRLGIGEPIEFDGIVRSLAVDPQRPERVYAGADCGVCISEDGGCHWRQAKGALQGLTVWSIAVDANNPSVLYAGTGAPSRAALYKSIDSGEVPGADRPPIFRSFVLALTGPGCSRYASIPTIASRCGLALRRVALGAAGIRGAPGSGSTEMTAPSGIPTSTRLQSSRLRLRHRRPLSSSR